MHALVDSGCSKSVISEVLAARLLPKYRVCPKRVIMLDGSVASYTRECCVDVVLDVGLEIQLWFMVASDLLDDVDCVLGMDAICLLGGVFIDDAGVTFGASNVCIPTVVRLTTRVCGSGICGDDDVGSEKSALSCGSGMCGDDDVGSEKSALSSHGSADLPGETGVEPLEIEDCDCKAAWNGKFWTVEWRWKYEAPQLNNVCGEYTVRKCDERAYHAEMEKWIDEGYLELHDWEKHGPVKAIIPLMAVSQPNKSTKVRPVMD